MILRGIEVNWFARIHLILEIKFWDSPLVSYEKDIYILLLGIHFYDSCSQLQLQRTISNLTF